ncbi:MAG: hypothetical protein IIB00_02690 [candidate division Zixibacteria bacterium]|nr:hypothetical protein [candidate division Zixibacteria bacterium]
MAYRKTTRRRTTSGRRTTTTARKATNHGRVKVWSAGEVSLLRKHYRNTTNEVIAKSLGRSVASVRAKAGALSLRKNANFLSIVAKSAGTGGFAKGVKRGRWAKPAGAGRRGGAKSWGGSRGRKTTTRRASRRW